ncbi:MAG: DUF2247 family protein [Candidatus Dependentiae bacterium]|nr:DUF2247 family protein [Candidatus Dependentiae bacterium]
MNVIRERKRPRCIFQDKVMAYSWSTIKVGRDIQVVTQVCQDIQIITFDDIAEFAIHFLELHPHLVNQYISEFMFKQQRQDIDWLLKNIFVSLNLEFPEKGSPAWNKEWRKWRYYLLTELIRVTENKEKLLIKVASLFSDFGYPKDMISFIYYIFADDNVAGSSLERTHAIFLNNLKLFLHEEKLRIDQGCDTLPDKIY